MRRSTEKETKICRPKIGRLLRKQPSRATRTTTAWFRSGRPAPRCSGQSGRVWTQRKPDISTVSPLSQSGAEGASWHCKSNGGPTALKSRSENIAITVHTENYVHLACPGGSKNDNDVTDPVRRYFDQVVPFISVVHPDASSVVNLNGCDGSGYC